MKPKFQPGDITVDKKNHTWENEIISIEGNIYNVVSHPFGRRVQYKHLIEDYEISFELSKKCKLKKQFNEEMQEIINDHTLSK